MRAQEFLAEVGDSPYQLPQRWKGDGFNASSMSVRLPSGKELQIEIHYEDRMALVNFFVGGDQSVTGEGDAVKIFSTVGTAINDYVSKRRPKVLAFTGAINELHPGRIRLYDRLANRWLTLPGFRGYVNLTDHEELWPDSLVSFMDEVQDISNQKIYVLASPAWMKSL